MLISRMKEYIIVLLYYIENFISVKFILYSFFFNNNNKNVITKLLI